MTHFCKHNGPMFKLHQIYSFVSFFATRSHIQSFSFVLTNITSDLTFGFCRHDASSNVAILMISYFPWHDVFLKFLNVLAEVKKNDGNQELERFLIESYKRRMSDEKNPVRMTYGSGMNVSINW